jgi:hypothetical protein
LDVAGLPRPNTINISAASDNLGHC